jgi:hypothetical protein
VAEAKQQSKGRFRRWLDKRREAQRRGADMTARAKAARKADVESARRHGSDSGGPMIGGF